MQTPGHLLDLQTILTPIELLQIGDFQFIPCRWCDLRGQFRRGPIRKKLFTAMYKAQIF